MRFPVEFEYEGMSSSDGSYIHKCVGRIDNCDIHTGPWDVQRWDKYLCFFLDETQKYNTRLLYFSVQLLKVCVVVGRWVGR